jgi:hypothetical protein
MKEREREIRVRDSLRTHLQRKHQTITFSNSPVVQWEWWHHYYKGSTAMTPLRECSAGMQPALASASARGEREAFHSSYACIEPRSGVCFTKYTFCFTAEHGEPLPLRLAGQKAHVRPKLLHAVPHVFFKKCALHFLKTSNYNCCSFP